MNHLILLYIATFATISTGLEIVDNPFLDTWNYIKNHHRAISVEDSKLSNVITTDREYFRNTILAPILIKRVSGTDGNRQVQAHIERLMSDLKWSITKDRFEDNTPYGRKQFTNIIADQNPLAPRKLTLACHFDSKYYEDIVFLAATDSAVPCAMLIDIATALNNSLWSSKKNSAVSLQLVFLDGEEAFQHWTATDSLYGSRHLAAKMQTQKVEVYREIEVSNLERMDMFCLLDLIGVSKPTFNSYFSNTDVHFTSLRSIETRLGNLGELSPSRGTHKYFSSSSRRGIQDDHIPFLKRSQ